MRRHPGSVALLEVLGVLFVAACTGSDPAGTASDDSTRVWIDVAYAGRSAAQRLDLYLPNSGAGPFPLVVWVHGGSWISGDKALGANAHQLRLLQSGYAVASINYRLAGEAVFPAQIHDVKAAIRFLRARAARYRLETSRIGVWGSSAGGHLVALLGTSGGVAEIEDLSLGNAAFSSAVQAVVNWYGPVNFFSFMDQLAALGCPLANRSPGEVLLGAPLEQRAALGRAASPLSWIDRTDPPFLIQHGMQDCTVPWAQSAELRDSLTRAIGASLVQYDTFSAGHGGAAFTAEANSQHVAAFFDRYLK